MPRFQNIILAYFVIGAVMSGGGAINWNNAGLANWFIHNDNGNVSVTNQTTTTLIGHKTSSGERTGGIGSVITGLINAFGGPLILIWNLGVTFVAYLHWPVVVLATNNAPPKVTILLGGGFVAGFYLSVIGMIMRGS